MLPFEITKDELDEEYNEVIGGWGDGRLDKTLPSSVGQPNRMQGQ